MVSGTSAGGIEEEGPSIDCFFFPIKFYVSEYAEISARSMKLL